MWVYDFREEMSRHFDTPDEFLSAVGYFAVGAALANRVYVRSPRHVGTNLYLILCSPPGWMHKSSSVVTAMEMLENIIPKEEVLPTNPSIEALGRKIPGACKNGTGHGILMYDEFRSFLTHIKKEYAAPLASLVTEKLERGLPVVFSKTKDSGTEEFVIPSRFVLSFVASTTTPWLLENIRGSDISGGMLARFLLVEAHEQTRMYELPVPVDHQALDRLGVSLRDIRDSFDGVEFSFSFRANRLYSSIYRDLHKKASSHGHQEFPALVSRSPLYIKKLALIHAVLSGRGKTLIYDEDVEAGAELVFRSIRSYEEIIDEAVASEGSYGKTVVRVKKILSAKRSVSKGELLKMTHIRPRELDEILESLAKQGVISEDAGGEREKERVVRLVKA